MARERPESGERVGRGEIYPTVGDSTRRNLDTAATVFGPLAGMFADFVERGQGVNATLTITDLGDSPQTFTLQITNDNPTRRLSAELKGNWSNVAEVPSGTPLMAGYSGRFSSISSTDGQPFAKPDDRVSPDGSIGVGTKGKGTRFIVRLPRDNFPRGATFVGYVAVDNQDVEPGTVLCYVEEIEEVK